MLNMEEKKRMVESGDHVVSMVDCCSCFLDPFQSLGGIGSNKMLMSLIYSPNRNTHLLYSHY